ncbi:MAG: hypothetical protein ACOYLO_16995 [Ferruginibacter sp.]
MENKIIDTSKIMLSIKRSEYLLEQILIQTVSARYDNVPLEERKSKVNESLNYVDEDVKAFVESLQTAK